MSEYDYNLVLMRDTCGNSRNKLKKYFYYKEYRKESFKYTSDYNELILLDIFEGSKDQKEYFYKIIPFLIIIALGALSWIVWIVICKCSKNPKGCLKRLTKTNNKTQRTCLFIFYGFAFVIILLLSTILIYLKYSQGDIEGIICSLSMLKYDLVYGEGLLSRDGFKMPYWLGLDNLSNRIQKVKDLLGVLDTNCNDIITNSNLKKNSGKNLYDNTGEAFLNDLNSAYSTHSIKYIPMTYPNSENIYPLYIKNLGPKEISETYLGKIYDDYQAHFNYLLKTIIDPVLNACEVFRNYGDPNRVQINNLQEALNNFETLINISKEPLNKISGRLTDYLAKHLTKLKSFYFLFFFILLSLMGICIIITSALYAIYYYNTFSGINSAITAFLYIMNGLMIFCLIYTGIFGVFSTYMANAADIIDCTFANENLVSVNPRIIDAASDREKLSRCFRGDGNLLDEYSDNNGRQARKELGKLYVIYNQIKFSLDRIKGNKNIYNSLSSIDEIVEEFNEMIDNYDRTTSKEEMGDFDINSLLNELNKYTIAGRKYQTVCPTAAYDIWYITSHYQPVAQPDENSSPFNYYDIISGSNPYGSTGCALDTSKNPEFSDISSAFSAIRPTISGYKTQNENILNSLISDLKTLRNNFQSDFIVNIKDSLDLIYQKIFVPLYENVFFEYMNDTTNYTSVDDESKIDIFRWINCDFLGRDYNITLNTIKTTCVTDLRVVTYCSFVCELLIFALFFIMIALTNNIRDKESEKQEDKYDIESKKEDNEIFEIIENNRYKDKYDYEGELITINKKSRVQRNIYAKDNNSNDYKISEEGLNFNTNNKTNDVTKNDITKDNNNINEEDLKNVKKELPKNIVNNPKFDVAENIEAIKNIDVRKRVDKYGKAVVHPVRISINSPLGVMEASDKYAEKYTYDVYESFHDQDSKGEPLDENGSYYQKEDKGKNKKKKDEDKKTNKDKEDKEEKKDKDSEFSF